MSSDDPAARDPTTGGATAPGPVPDVQIGASERADLHGPPVGTPHPSARLVVLLGALSAFSPLAIDMYLPAFPQIARDLKTPAGSIELTLSVFLAGLALGQLVCGPISDRVGRRRPLLVGCTGFAVAAVLCAYTRSIEGLIAARFLMGLAGASGLVLSRAVVRDLFNVTDSARMYSMMMLVTGVAPVLAPSLGGQLLAHGGWRAIFWVLAGCGTACGAAVALDLRETLPPERRARDPVAEIPGRYWAMLGDRRFLGPALSIGLGAGLLFAYISGSPFAFMQLYGVSPRTFGLLFASNAIGLFGAAQVNRWLLRHFSSHEILQGASAANAAAGVLLVCAAGTGFGGFVAFFVLLFACLATLGLIFPNATAAAMAPFARQAGSASALLGMLQYTVGAGAGALVGLLHDGTARPMAGIIACCGVCGSLITARSKHRRSWTA